MNTTKELDFWCVLDQIKSSVQGERLADVCRFVSFVSFESYQLHHHIRIEINYVKRGSCVLYLEEENLLFSEGDIMVIWSDVPHAFQAGPQGAVLMQLEFLPTIFSGFEIQKMLKQKHSSSNLGEEHQVLKIVNDVRIMRTIQRIIHEIQDKRDWYDYLVMIYYAELLLLIHRHIAENILPRIQNQVLQKALAYIRLSYQEDISMLHLASHCTVSDRCLRKLFSKYLNISPVDYINQVRISKAAELLRSTDLSVKEVCFACGFNSSQYFARTFKKQMGFSPKEILSRYPKNTPTRQ